MKEAAHLPDSNEDKDLTPPRKIKKKKQKYVGYQSAAIAPDKGVWGVGRVSAKIFFSFLHKNIHCATPKECLIVDFFSEWNWCARKPNRKSEKLSRKNSRKCTKGVWLFKNCCINPLKTGDC